MAGRDDLLLRVLGMIKKIIATVVPTVKDLSTRGM
jgi:hypothetical protein